MQLTNALLTHKLLNVNYTNYEHNKNCRFAFCNKLADRSFEQIHQAYMCKDNFHEEIYRLLNSNRLKDKENFYLLLKPIGLSRNNYVNSINLINNLEKLLDWKESNYSFFDNNTNNTNDIIININSNWVLTPYLFHFILYCLRGCFKYTTEQNPVEFLKTGCNGTGEGYIIKNYFFNIEHLFTEKMIYKQSWKTASCSKYNYGFTSSKFNKEEEKKQIEIYDKKKETCKFKDWYSLEFI